MRDPYQVLGVSRGATEEEIKKAYKALSRRYHPDANINNPNKDQAEEKFKEIQAAYQQIMKEKTEDFSGQGYGYSGYGSNGYGNSGYGNGNYGSGSGGSGYGRQGYDYGPFGGFGGFGGFYGGGYDTGSNTGYEEDSHLRAAGNYIRNGYYKEARTVLDNMGMQERNAKWYYYSAIAHSALGNNVAALDHAKRASAMEPGNTEYRRLVEGFESGGTWYQQRQAEYGYPRSGGGDICMKICIANLVCNLCCGGGGLCCGGRGFYY